MTLILLSSIGISMTTGLLGCFIVWKRMSYFCDSIAHNALIGISLGILFGISQDAGIIITSIIFASILIYLQNKHKLSNDNILGIISHGGLAIGIIILSLLGHNIDLHDILFGNISNITIKDIIIIYFSVIITYFLIIINWEKLILSSINKDFATIYGINNMSIQMILMFLMAIIVAISINIVGMLLIASLLIIPPSISRLISKTPSQMAIFSVIISIFVSISGILTSYYFKIPSGPSIVLISIIIFIILISFPRKK